MTVPTQDTLSSAELAEQYGWAQAVLNSDPELAKLFKEAVAGQWSPERFQAKLRATKWYQSRSESARQADILKKADPQTYNANVEQLMAEMRQQAGQLGATLDEGKLRWRAEQAYRLGWNQVQITSVLAQYVTAKDGVMKGVAGQTAEALRAAAYANGVRYSDDWFVKAAKSVVSGNTSPEDWEQQIRKQAASAWPTFSEQIMAGQNMMDVASPYRQSMSALLEINDADVDLFDPTIRSALARRDPKTGQATAQSLWEFENGLRKDTRWLKTNNARESLMGVTRAVLSDWGFAG